jgi:predicted GIY-YIG superfamily endonuclease
MVTWLYRHFDDAGVLLYVGITDDLAQRRREHEHSSDWFARVVETMTVRYPTRVAAVEAERMAIAFERPAFNRALRNQVRELQVMLVRAEIERLKGVR